MPFNKPFPFSTPSRHHRFMQRTLLHVAYQTRSFCAIFNASCKYSATLRQLRHFQTSSSRLKESDDKDASKVRFFQQASPWSSTREPSDPDHPFLDTQTAKQVKKLREKVMTLRGELKDMERRLDDGTIFEPLLQKMPLEDQEKYWNTLAESKSLEKQKSDAIKALLPSIEIKAEVSSMQRHHLTRLNNAVRASLEEIDTQEVRGELARTYSRCRALAPQILPNIPEAAWDILFNMSVSSQINGHPQWATHRITFYDDMISVGRPPSLTQKLLYLDALQHAGRQEEAIARWQDLRNEYEQDSSALAHYELIGVQLFTSQGNPRRAEQIAFEYLKGERPEESRILIGILASWAERGDEIGRKHAWVLYLEIRSQLGPRISMQDYDNIIMAFLKAEQTNLALAVFKDMMQTGQEAEEESLKLFKKATGLIADSQHKSITVEDINTVALTSLTSLPRRFRNRFFFGCWLKRLIGMGEVDAAAQVIHFMRQLGIKPDPKHLNGIIGAWLRSDAEGDHEKAERLAWAMIHQRLDFVKGRAQEQRKASLSSSALAQAPNSSEFRDAVSPATIETFSTLLFYYVNRKMDGYVDFLQEVLSAAQIPPDRYFMNHLLFQDRLRNDHIALWEKYVNTFAQTEPDLETFECLWDAEKKHLEKILLNQPDQYPGPRIIMREMARWLLTQNPRSRKRAINEFSKDLYERIIRCMCLAKDFEGAIVAAYFLRDMFGAYPDANTAEAVILTIARLAMDSLTESQAEWKPRRHRLKGNTRLKARRDHVAQIYAAVQQDRSQQLQTSGLLEKDMNKSIYAEESLFNFSIFLQRVLARLYPHPQECSSQQNLQKAAYAMGIDNIIMDDPLFSYKTSL